MSVVLNPYLSFIDIAREAMEYYHSVFGGTLTLTTFGEMPNNAEPDEADKIMHGQIDGDHGIVLMGSDTPKHMQTEQFKNGTSISLSGDDEAVLRGYWEKLVDGGSMTVPLETSPWGAAFGMCTDRYGVDWMVNITPKAA
ncbi:VOC family protein [Microterricola viridarii]|uniref:PhnB protein n=1 Tax=Microterricola viridarii TaxID=412690 RepID=A0A1H1YDK5_9MICO|nr:VOC family protein [Microterricola viridarii]SDT19359.1 PhnB protein [Microterricola viridarii]